jgi:uncharacterized membrane protein YfcA
MLYNVFVWLWLPLSVLSVMACLKYGFLWRKLRWFFTGSLLTFALSLPAEEFLPMREYGILVILLANIAILLLLFHWRKIKVDWQEWVIMFFLSLPLYLLCALVWIDSAHYLGVRV